MEATLLVELLTEELPPKSLRTLMDAFADQLVTEIVRHRLRDRVASKKAFATPRRLAVLIPDVRDKGLDSEHRVEGPSSANQKAVEGFAKKHKVAPDALERRQTPKGEIVVAHVKLAGVNLDSVLANIVDSVVKKLPVAKVMRWGSGEAQFVRPVHGLVMMHGSRVVPGNVLGAQSRATTQGHRFMSLGPLALPAADAYEEILRRDGMVIADFAVRRAEIERQLQAAAARESASLGKYADLLDEVAALVEFPVVYSAGFPVSYLEIPQECLILTMRQNQKYFPLFGANGGLLPRFLIVSNMKAQDPRHIVGGNERVVRPRLEDARFFYEQDRKRPLESRVPELAKVIYHNKLGSQLERVERVQLLAGTIARKLGADVMLAERAAWLSKADLLTGMVGEFPELQGVMGRYYAKRDGEPEAVADSIESHYRPRFSGDELPHGPVACALALADKLDALAGLFGVGQVPTGDKDPFALRRAALGVIRILLEEKIALGAFELIGAAVAGVAGRPGVKDAHEEIETFLLERARTYLHEKGYSATEVEAVLCLRPGRLDLVPRQLEAVRAFSELPEAESLAAANKRIANILKQAGAAPTAFDADLLLLPEEKDLAARFRQLKPQVESAFEALDYTSGLRALASLKAPVDAFFDKVMVMDKDPRIRANRIGFLGTLHGTMNRIADLSKLAK